MTTSLTWDTGIPDLVAEMLAEPDRLRNLAYRVRNYGLPSKREYIFGQWLAAATETFVVEEMRDGMASEGALNKVLGYLADQVNVETLIEGRAQGAALDWVLLWVAAEISAEEGATLSETEETRAGLRLLAAFRRQALAAA